MFRHYNNGINMIINRFIFKKVNSQLGRNKAILIFGSRRTGKTVLLNEIFKEVKEDALLLNGEDPSVRDLLENINVKQIKQLLNNKRKLFIDEAQKVVNIGGIVKLMLDELPDLCAVLTGSSAFDMKNQFGEPLTGRKITHYLYPFSQIELSKYETLIDTMENLENKMIFGGYPEVFSYSERNDKIDYLRELVNDYLFRDILTLDHIRQSSKIQDILRMLAFQIGKDVSNEELGRQTGLNRLTVEKYLDLLSKVFIIFKVPGFSKNLRKEITKSNRWYFYDNGVLNTLLTNFSALSRRNDVGRLWENYLVSERVKILSYTGQFVNTYFWRTYDQQEIDWVEEKDGQLTGFEIKWKEEKIKPPAAWSKAYPESQYKVIHRKNYLAWIT